MVAATVTARGDRSTTEADPGNVPPLVSVGLPVYNGERFLGQALEALLAQDWPNLEILVSDNGSTDGTAAISASFAARDPRVRVMSSPMNTGIGANFMRVLDAARGEYFMWAACDDFWQPAFVGRLVEALERTPGAVVAMSAVERADEAGVPIDVVRYAGTADPGRLAWWQLTMRLAGGRPYHLFVYGLYRTAFIKASFTGFAPVVAADRLFMCRVAMAGGFVSVDEVLHRRTIRRVPIGKRYADEAIGHQWRGTLPRWRLALHAGPYLWRSPLVPARRKVWIPLIVARLLKSSAGHMLADLGWLRRRGPASSPHVDP